MSRKELRTHCTNGHAWTQENVYIQPSNGARRCKMCASIKMQSYRSVSVPLSHWTEKESELRRLWSEGHSTAEIGRMMGVSKNAVVGRAHRLRLPGRASPIIRTGQPRVYPATRKSAAPTLLLLSETVVMPTTRLNNDGARIPIAGKGAHARGAIDGITLASVRAAAPVRLVAIPASTQCLYPLWADDERPTQQFCNDPTTLREDGCRSSWCLAHHKRCTSRAPSKAKIERARQARELARIAAARNAPGRLAAGVVF